jgi:ATP-dependent RNA helicase DbpA
MSGIKMSSFSSLSLSKEMLNNLNDLNYKIMTPVQKNSIPSILNGKDVLAQAKTGSGKTAAYGIGFLHNLDVKCFRVQTIVLCPTRELAEQITGELRRIARFKHNIKLLKLTGGFPMYKQELSLKHQAHIVVGTPGRVLKLLQRGALNLDNVKVVVLDEADRMLDMGFADQIKDIMSFAPAQHQTLCFSATFPDEVRKLSKSVLTDPVEITVETQHDETVIKQLFYKIPSQKKGSAVLALLCRYRPDSTIIFCNTKDACRRVMKELNSSGLHSLALHGDLEQKERDEILIRFANGSTRVLVATDVAARGIDIESLGAVINFDLPFEKEIYVHRIGRTGRAGQEGLALSLMEPGENFRINEINEICKSDFKPVDPDFEYSKDAPPAFEPEMITLSINGGRKNKISAGDILGALTFEDEIKGSDVGKIDRMDYLTFIAVKRKSAKRALSVLENGQIKGRRFLAMIND